MKITYFYLKDSVNETMKKDAIKLNRSAITNTNT